MKLHIDDDWVLEFVHISKAKDIKRKGVYTGGYEKLDLKTVKQITYWFFDVEISNNLKISTIRLAMFIYKRKCGLVFYEDENKVNELFETVREHIEKLKKAEIDKEDNLIWEMNLNRLIVENDYVFYDDEGNLVYWITNGRNYILDKEKYEKLKFECYVRML